MGNGKPQRPKRTTAADTYVGGRIRSFRLGAKMSQTDLAKVLGVTFQQVQKYEKGVNRVGPDRLMRVCQVFQIEIKDLMPPHDAPKGRSDPLHLMGQSNHGQRLARAFNAVTDPSVRTTIVAHIEALVAACAVKEKSRPVRGG